MIRRRLLAAVALALVLWAQPAYAAIVLVANTAAGSTNNTSVTTSAIDTTGATLIVIGTGSTSSTVPTDNKSNTWTRIRVQTGGAFSGHLDLYYCATPTVGSGHTFSLTDTSPVVAVLAFSGTSSTPLDQHNGADGTSTTAQQPGSVTPTAANSVLVTVASTFPIVTLTVDSGFTLTNQIAGVGSQNWGIDAAYLIQGAAAAVNPTWTQSGGSWNYSAVIANFLPTGAGGSPVPKCNGGLLLRGVGCQGQP